MRRPTTIRHTAAVALCVLSAGLLSACSSPSAPEAGNVIETAPASTMSTTVAAVDTTIAEIVTSSSVSPSTVPVFVPPSTTLPDDPDLREAIRVRIAVEAEFDRQRYKGIADPIAFQSLADPNTWLPIAIRALQGEQSAGLKFEANTVSAVYVLDAKLQSKDSAIISTCVINDDKVIDTNNTPDTNDDETTHGLTRQRLDAVMVRKEDGWLYQGSVEFPSELC